MFTGQFRLFARWFRRRDCLSRSPEIRAFGGVSSYLSPFIWSLAGQGLFMWLLYPQLLLCKVVDSGVCCRFLIFSRIAQITRLCCTLIYQISCRSQTFSLFFVTWHICSVRENLELLFVWMVHRIGVGSRSATIINWPKSNSTCGWGSSFLTLYGRVLVSGAMVLFVFGSQLGQFGSSERSAYSN